MTCSKQLTKSTGKAARLLPRPELACGVMIEPGPNCRQCKSRARLALWLQSYGPCRGISSSGHFWSITIWWTTATIRIEPVYDPKLKNQRVPRDGPLRFYTGMVEFYLARSKWLAFFLCFAMLCFHEVFDCILRTELSANTSQHAHINNLIEDLYVNDHANVCF